MTTEPTSFDELLFYADALVEGTKSESLRIKAEAQASGVLDFITGPGDLFGFGEESENWDALPIALDHFTDDVYPGIRARVEASGSVDEARALSVKAERVLAAAYDAGPLIDFEENTSTTKQAIIDDAVAVVEETSKALQPFASYPAFMAGGAAVGVVASVSIPVVSLEQRLYGALVGGIVGAGVGAGVRWALGRAFAPLVK